MNDLNSQDREPEPTEPRAAPSPPKAAPEDTADEGANAPQEPTSATDAPAPLFAQEYLDALATAKLVTLHRSLQPSAFSL